jgi:hypothetical protein
MVTPTVGARPVEDDDGDSGLGEVLPKTEFPSDLVYGATDTPGQRLVTCGGRLIRKVVRT